ncbi:hypothetical protein VYU27_009936, partial [Nannochloropsis oceanica]
MKTHSTSSNCRSTYVEFHLLFLNLPSLSQSVPSPLHSSRQLYPTSSPPISSVPSTRIGSGSKRSIVTKACQLAESHIATILREVGGCPPFGVHHGLLLARLEEKLQVNVTTEVLLDFLSEYYDLGEWKALYEADTVEGSVRRAYLPPPLPPSLPPTRPTPARAMEEFSPPMARKKERSEGGRRKGRKRKVMGNVEVKKVGRRGGGKGVVEGKRGKRKGRHGKKEEEVV